MSEPRLRLAVLGCGQAAVLAARALRGLHGVSCAYASREPERAARFARKLGGRAFGSYEEAMSSPDVDAVLVATPPATHFELALRALECGKSVVLEKPPTLRSGELDALGTLARLAGRRVMVAENYFYKPLARALRELIGDGAVGELLFVHVNALKTQRAEGWRSDPGLAGGGALFEGGIHWVDLLANLGPRVERVEGFLAGVNGTPLRRSQRARRVPLLDRCRRHALVLLGDRVGAAGAAAVARVRPRGVDRLRVERAVPGDVGTREAPRVPRPAGHLRTPRHVGGLRPGAPGEPGAAVRPAPRAARSRAGGGRLRVCARSGGRRA